MRRIVFVLAVVLVGCGGSGESDPLAGKVWAMPINGNYCAYGLGFYNDSTYMQAVVCTLGDGSQGAEVERGDYRVSGHTLSITVKQTSCATTVVNDSVDFSVTNGNLNLMFPEGLAVLTPIAAMPGGVGGTIPYGCYSSDWTFYPMPIHPI